MHRKKIKANLHIIFTSVYVSYDVNSIGLDTITEAIEKLDYKVKNKLEYQADTNKDKRINSSSDKMSINQLIALRMPHQVEQEI